jgi:hypothetical protein
MFVAFGPAIGGTALGLWFIALDILDGGQFHWGAITTLPLLAVAAYIFGLLPAFFTGVAAMALSPRIFNDRLWLLAVTAVGLVSGVVYVFLSPSTGLLMGGIGAVAALASGILALAIRPLGPEIIPAILTQGRRGSTNPHGSQTSKRMIR